MLSPLAQRLIAATLWAAACAPVAGCLTADRDQSSGAGTEATARSHAGSDGDSDGSGWRIVLRPQARTAQVGNGQVFIVTLYDPDSKPRPDQQVEWTLDGPGTIAEVAGRGVPGDPARTADTKHATGQTESSEQHVIRAGDEFTIGPGQSWCVVTSAAEGETTLTVTAPGGSGRGDVRAHAKIRWSAGDVRFPPSASAAAGGECSLTTRLAKGPGAAGADHVRYRILGGPSAALKSDARPGASVTEAVVAVAADGTAQVTVSQPAPVAGANRIAVELIKPNPNDPSGFSVVSAGETTVTWRAPEWGVTISAPKAVTLQQDVLVTYSVTTTGPATDRPATAAATIPPGLDLVRTEPGAVRDGDQLIWTLAGVGSQHPVSVTAVFRPIRVGRAELAADARAADGQSRHASAVVQVTAAKLLLKLDGPTSGLAGDTLPFRLAVTNVGDGPAEKVRVQARLEDGPEATAKSVLLDETVGTLGPGQSKTLSLPVAGKHGGKVAVQATAAADGSVIAVPQSATVDIHQADLALSVHGPGRAYVGQEASWKLVVRNLGDVPLTKTVVRAKLPAELGSVKATGGGRVSGRNVEWDLGTLADRQTRTLEITGVCEKLSAQTGLIAMAGATPAAGQDGGARPARQVGPDRPVEVPLEIIGIPSLQLSVKDSADPIGVGQRTTYTIRVKNAGTLAAKRVGVSAEIVSAGSADTPRALKPIRATGPGSQGTIEGYRVTFPVLDAIAPNAEVSFTVEAEGAVPGEARLRAEVKGAMTGRPLRAEEPTRVLGRESPPAGK